MGRRSQRHQRSGGRHLGADDVRLLGVESASRGSRRRGRGGVGRSGSGAARVNSAGEDTAAKLRIDVGGFFGDYWILEVGESYEYAVIGVPSRDYLWILSRTAKLDQTKLDGILARTRAAKFDTARLEYTLQAP